MEKLIIYAIAGIVYFIYTAVKKSQEQQKPAPNPLPKTDTGTGTVRPPTNATLEDVMREIKRKQAAAAEAQRKPETAVSQPQVQTVAQKNAPPKDIFIREKKKATFGEGAKDAPVYEREETQWDKTARGGDIKLKNEGVYKVETMEEARALADNTEQPAYEFDAKQAFIGSVIFETKY